MTIEANLADASDYDIAHLVIRCLDALATTEERIKAILAAIRTTEDREALAAAITEEESLRDEEDLEEDEE